LTAGRLVAAVATLVTFGAGTPARGGVDRPPQFIVMAFDNCTELERWQELTDFVAELNRGTASDSTSPSSSAAAISSPTAGGASMKVRTSGGATPASALAARPSKFAGASNT